MQFYESRSDCFKGSSLIQVIVAIHVCIMQQSTYKQMSEQNECETEGHPIQNETFYSEENLHARLMKSRTYLACPSVHMLIFEVINIFSLCC